MNHIVYLQVENDICVAKASPIYHPHHRAYHVLFEDGYENVFFTDVETGNWIEEDLGETLLAETFGMKIDLLNVVPDDPYKPLAWCRAAVAGKIICFGFHQYTADDETIFELYADNRMFLYQFNSNGKRWKVYNENGLLKAHQYTKTVKIFISIFCALADNL